MRKNKNIGYWRDMNEKSKKMPKKSIKFQIPCDYCEKYSPSLSLAEKNKILQKLGWRDAENETICPDCAKTGEYPSDEIGNRLKDVFKFKNMRATADAFLFDRQNMTNLNNGSASGFANHLVLTIIELAKTMPLKKRREIIKNIDFSLDK